MTKSAEIYYIDGCGRCSLMATEKCKVRTWNRELIELRRIVLECGLTEESKWGMPCYTDKGKNILIVTAFKESCAVNFFKGTLITDFAGILTAPGENSNAARYAKFTELEKILQNEDNLKAYIFEAIEIERSGKKIEPKPQEEIEIPEELQEKFDEMPDFEKAFNALTPGRRKNYLQFFAQAKQAKTRMARIEKYIPFIFNGKGLNEY